jgi:hypothetical protein
MRSTFLKQPDFAAMETNERPLWTMEETRIMSTFLKEQEAQNGHSEPLSIIFWEGLEPLTPAERRAYEAVERYWHDHCRGMTYRELATQTGRALSTFHATVGQLKRKGWVHSDPGSSGPTLVPAIRAVLHVDSRAPRDGMLPVPSSSASKEPETP